MPLSQTQKDDYLDFLLKVLPAIADNRNELQKVYPLLKANLDRLDDSFTEILNNWAAITFSKVELAQTLVIAEALVNFGNLLRSFPYGDRAMNLEIAIVACEAVNPIFLRETFPEYWATTQNMLGILYRNRIRGNHAQNLEQAIQYLENALQVRTRKDFPIEWAETQNSLGNVYNERIIGNRAENVEKAIVALKAALEIRTREALPKNWATTQNNLGIAYYNRWQEERGENLERAITCYQNALQIRTQEDFPIEWAETQNNLANAYSERIRGDRAENLERALAAFQSVLQVYTCENFPHDWAMTQNNIGETYRSRIRGDRKKNLDAAIMVYQEALLVYSFEAFPERWAILQNNLGIAHYSQKLDDRTETLERAITCYQNALQIRTQKNFPIEWAETQNNLGNAYGERIRGNRTENLENAIDAYQAALQIHTRKSFPHEWAKTHNNLASVYHDRGQSTEAISCFHSALQVYTPLTFPFECLTTGRNLGNTALAYREWIEAIKGYHVAIEAVEQSRTWAITDVRRQEILSNAIAVYANIVQACINNNQSDKALEYVERSKARNLVELLASRDIYPKGDISKTVLNELKRLRREVVAEQRRLDIAEQNRLGGEQRLDSAAWLKDRDRLNQLLQQLDNLITNEIDPIDPNFRATQQVKPISSNEIQNLVDERTAIVEWYINDDNFHTFTITNQSQHPQVWSSSAGERQAFLDWQEEYLQDYQENREQWIEKLSDRLYRLSEILHIDDIINSLPSNCDQIILIPHRFLHLIPLHTVPLSQHPCLIDRFPRGVRYAPSCQLLQLTQNPERTNFERFLAMQNPTKDLGYTSVEVGTIQHYFRHTDVFVENAAKKATIIEVKIKDNGTREVIQNSQLSLANCAHFSCHGEFNFESPLDSALLLADGERLTLGEIFDLDLSQCRLVTLSACETGLTNYKILSDEYVGIPSSFLYAGSPSVVSSLWTVQDVSTAFLMIKFYQNLSSYETVVIALNQAQTWLRNLSKKELQEWISENKISLDATLKMNLRRRLHKMSDSEQPFKSPFHWAAFCAIGQ
ncbi:MAG: CHAT domain-containing protein [Symploca sp. SIO1C4]|uniref:CHAT domain-containing protein n=1 Tax=Symploca sp. SIO1C4 TaxID=2607765 RepID=A0A6B3NIY2_9CYAN|nr:CHAT domain-containing protein [Symploca sp. SIO1C4]